MQSEAQILREVSSLHERIDFLENEIKHLQSNGRKETSDALAEKLIADFISQKKKEGVKEIDVLDIADFLRLPFSQINRIMEKLKSRGLKEV